MVSNSRPPVSPHARREASEWLLLLRERESDLEVRTSFLAWIRNSPENVHAFLRMLATWEATGLLEGSALFDRDALLAEARQSSNVLELDPGVSEGAIEAPAKRRRLPVGIAAAVTGLLVLGAAFSWYQTQKDVYGTNLGEQRTVALQDGSTIVLNSKSRVRVRLGDRQRDVDLLQGQALFRVAHNAVRPFVVHSGSASVRAVGTEFDVYRKQTGTIVTVVEGTVAVEALSAASDERGREHTAGGSSDPHIAAPLPQVAPASNASRVTDSDLSAPALPPAQRSAAATNAPDIHSTVALHQDTDTVLLSAGEQITVTGLEVPSPRPADIAVATAWTQGKLIFKDTPLSEVVSEFNRSSARRLVIDAPDLNQFHVTGVFLANDPQRLVDLVKRRFGVSVHEGDDEIRIYRP
jgi:transmembrane sensor